MMTADEANAKQREFFAEQEAKAISTTTLIERTETRVTALRKAQTDLEALAANTHLDLDELRYQWRACELERHALAGWLHRAHTGDLHHPTN